jgi:hypothetical protein
MTGPVLGSRVGSSLIIASVTLVACCLVAASVAEAKGENVTFINQSRRAQQILAAFGEGDSCSEKTQRENLKIEAGERVVLESGDSTVCWCAGSGKAKVGRCQEWNRARAGSKVYLKF